VCCTGLAAQGFTPFVSKRLDARGRVLPDRYLRTPKHPAIFVAGDIANVLAETSTPS